MNSIQIFVTKTVNQKLLKWSLFFLLTLCTIISAESEPKEVEDTKPTLVNIVL